MQQAEDDTKDESEDLPNPNRKELFLRIRQGLGDLVEDVDEVER